MGQQQCAKDVFVLLVTCLQDKDMDKLRALGGVTGLADTLQSHAHHGLDPATSSGPASIEEHRRVFGANTMPAVPQKNFFVLCFENIQDPIILLLIAAALVSRGCRLAPGSIEGFDLAAAVMDFLHVCADCSTPQHSNIHFSCGGSMQACRLQPATATHQRSRLAQTLSSCTTLHACYDSFWTDC